MSLEHLLLSWYLSQRMRGDWAHAPVDVMNEIRLSQPTRSLSPESQDPSLVLTVLYVPNSVGIVPCREISDGDYCMLPQPRNLGCCRESKCWNLEITKSGVLQRNLNPAKRPRTPRRAGEVTTLQGYLAHKKQPPPLGPPHDPRYSPTVGSWVGGVSYE